MNREQVDLIINELADVLSERVNKKVRKADKAGDRKNHLTLLRELMNIPLVARALREIVCDKLEEMGKLDD